MIRNKKLVEDTDLYFYEIGMLEIINLLPNKTIENKIKDQWFKDNHSDAIMLLEHNGYVHHIKSKNKPWHSVRLTKKGKEFIKELYSTPVTELANNCLDILTEYYERYELKSKIKNKKKTLFYINEWLDYKETEKGIAYTLKQFEAVIWAYLDSFDYAERKFTKNTLSLFFETSNVFSTRWFPESCPFEDFINKEKQTIKDYYRKL